MGHQSASCDGRGGLTRWYQTLILVTQYGARLHCALALQGGAPLLRESARQESRERRVGSPRILLLCHGSNNVVVLGGAVVLGLAVALAVVAPTPTAGIGLTAIVVLAALALSWWAVRNESVRIAYCIAIALGPLMWQMPIFAARVEARSFMISAPLVGLVLMTGASVLSNWSHHGSGVSRAMLFWILSMPLCLAGATISERLSILLPRNGAIMVSSLLACCSFFFGLRWVSRRMWRAVSVMLVVTAIGATLGRLQSLSAVLYGARLELPGVLSPNQLGQVLFLGLAAVLYGIATTRGWIRLLAILCGSYLEVALLLTFSREGIVSILVGLVVWWQLRRRHSRAENGAVGWSIFLGSAGVFSAVIGLVARARTVFYSEGYERLKSVLGLTLLSTLQGSRVRNVWVPSLGLLNGVRWAWGVSASGLEVISQVATGATVYNGDNAIVGILVTQGLFGLVPFLALVLALCVSLRQAIHLFPSARESEFEFSAIVGISYVASALIAPHFMWPYWPINAIVFLVMGMMVGELRRSTGAVGDSLRYASVEGIDRNFPGRK